MKKVTIQRDAIIVILKRADAGMGVKDFYRKAGISVPTHRQ